MPDVLTIAEIQAKFAGEWVLLEDPTTSPSLEVHGGKVLFHSKDRDEVYRQAVALRPRRFALVYTGVMPPDTAIVLAGSGQLSGALSYTPTDRRC